MTPSELQPHTKESLQDDLLISVFEKIEKERITHVPRWQFLLYEYGVWAVWVASVFVGAIAFCVMLFFATRAGYAFYEVTHESPLRFFLEMVPLVWVLLFILMAVIAHYYLRHTKYGYKYQVWQILLSSLIVSFITGALLFVAGIGYVVDHFVAQRVSFLPALEKIEMKLWQDPEHGRLVGVYSDEGSTDQLSMFVDREGKFWHLDTSELNDDEMEVLRTGDVVKIVGVQSTSSEAYFHGCGVFVWKGERSLPLYELRQDRESFLSRMKAHHQQIAENQLVVASSTVLSRFMCGSLPSVTRIQAKFAE